MNIWKIASLCVAGLLAVACGPVQGRLSAYDRATRGDPDPDPDPSASSAAVALDASAPPTSDWQRGFASLDDAGGAKTCFLAGDFNRCAWLAQTLSGDPGLVVSELLARPPSTTTNLFTLAFGAGWRDVPSRLPEVYVALVDEPDRFLQATRALADDGTCALKRASVQLSSQALWATRPEKRDTLLYLMASTLLRCKEDASESAEKKLAGVMTSLGAPFSLATFSRILDQSPRSYQVAVELFPFVKDEGKRTRVDVVMDHLPAYVDRARGLYIAAVGFPSDKLREGLHAHLLQLYIDLAERRDARDIAKLHAALAAYRSDAEVDAAFGDLADLSAGDAPAPRR